MVSFGRVLAEILPAPLRRQAQAAHDLATQPKAKPKAKPKAAGRQQQARWGQDGLQASHRRAARRRQALVVEAPLLHACRARLSLLSTCAHMQHGPAITCHTVAQRLPTALNHPQAAAAAADDGGGDHPSAAFNLLTREADWVLRGTHAAEMEAYQVGARVGRGGTLRLQGGPMPPALRRRPAPGSEPAFEAWRRPPSSSAPDRPRPAAHT